MSFNSIGQRIAAASCGLSNTDFDFQKQAAEVLDVEHKDPVIRERSTNFWQSFCSAYADLEKQANGETPDYFVMKKLASQPVWISEFQTMAETYAESVLDGQHAAHEDTLDKRAAAVGALIPGLASRAVGTAPTLVKSMLAAGIGGGMASGGLYWALQRAATEDSDKKLDAMQAKIDEYNKLKAMISTDADNNNVQEEENLRKKITRF